MNEVTIIAIDGPSSSGKGTIGRAIANHFGFSYMDTGLLYRALAKSVIDAKADPLDEEKVCSLLSDINYSFINDSQLKGELVGTTASIISKYKKVREHMDKIQLSFPEGKDGVVVDGRDIGAKIFPKATCKLYITAALDVRIKRRKEQLENQLQISEKSIINNEAESLMLHDLPRYLAERDKRDANRDFSPLTCAEDAIIIDTTELTVSDSINLAIKRCEEQIRLKEGRLKEGKKYSNKEANS